jgi:hypothetical protein
MDAMYLQKIEDIPVPSEGYSLVAKSVASDDSLLFLFIEPAGASAVRETDADGIGIFPKTRMIEPKRFRLSIAKAAGPLQTIELPELDTTFPLVDIFPDGKILIVGSRCEWRGDDDHDLNGTIIDPKTGKLLRILLGDCINSTYVDALGRIWVAYGDEGVFGNFGWGDPGPAPVGAAGLVCFSESGEKVWELEDDRMADCYALNVSGAKAAVCFYTDFPVCRISSDFELTCWETNLQGCHAFAISETEILFSGQYHDPPGIAHLGSLEAGGLINTRQVRLLLPDGSAVPKVQLLGRGRHLYYFDSRSAYRASLG